MTLSTNKVCHIGLRWWQSDEEAIQMGRVYYVFNPEIYTEETLKKANQLIDTSLKLWNNYGFHSEKDRRAVEILKKQYYNNQRRIYHFSRLYNKKIDDLQKQFLKLKI